MTQALCKYNKLNKTIAWHRCPMPPLLFQIFVHKLWWRVEEKQKNKNNKEKNISCMNVVKRRTEQYRFDTSHTHCCACPNYRDGWGISPSKLVIRNLYSSQKSSISLMMMSFPFCDVFEWKCIREMAQSSNEGEWLRLWWDFEPKFNMDTLWRQGD